MIILFVILACILFVGGDLIRSAHMEPEERWIPIGKFMMYVALFIFIVMIIVSTVQWLTA